MKFTFFYFFLFFFPFFYISFIFFTALFFLSLFIRIKMKMRNVIFFMLLYESHNKHFCFILRCSLDVLFNVRRTEWLLCCVMISLSLTHSLQLSLSFNLHINQSFFLLLLIQLNFILLFPCIFISLKLFAGWLGFLLLLLDRWLE